MHIINTPTTCKGHIQKKPKMGGLEVRVGSVVVWEEEVSVHISVAGECLQHYTIMGTGTHIYIHTSVHH